jgi:hypothetical protein
MKKGIYFTHPEKASTPKMEVLQKSTKPTKGVESVERSEPKSDDLHGSIIRMTVDMPKKQHKAVKRLLVEEELSFKAYLLELIDKDFKSRGIEI